MNKYVVKRIDLSKVNTTEEYWDAVKRGQVHYCNGLKEVWEFCGGRLHRERHGYAGRIGNIEYVAVKSF